jgi:antibiotic biosynthesis monooxygenase (ABM) superfamily enzyme
MHEVIDYLEADPIWNKFTGLEYWFTPPKGTIIPQPSRFRMALVMIAVVFGLVLTIGQLVSMVAANVPYYLRLFVTLCIDIFLLTYVVMPRITRLLAKWIYPSTKTVAAD